MRERRKLPPNHLLREARQRLPSPSRPAQWMSRQELADAVNAYMAATDESEATLDANHVGKLERGDHRWPNDLRRAAFRHVLKASTDSELGFYIIRGIRSRPLALGEGGYSSPHITTATPAPAPPVGEPGVDGHPADLARQREPEDIYRRTLLGGSLASVPLGLLGSALTLDDIRQIVAALHDAHRYLGSEVIGHLRQRLAECASDDGLRGPRSTLPAVMAVIAVVEHNARRVKPAVRRELLCVGARGSEFAGWLYRDVGESELADYWRDRATEWAQEGGDHAMPGYVLLKKSQSAWDARDALRMLTLAQAVQDGPWPLPARVRAEAAQQEARGHAMIDRNIHAAKGKLDEARELLANDNTTSHAGTDAELANHYDRSLLAVQTAMCHCEAGQPDRAVEIYREALDPSVFSPRDHAYFLSLLGIALAAASRPDEAATAGITALPVAAAASSVRTIRELLRLRRHLTEWADRPAVREFANALPV